MLITHDEDKNAINDKYCVCCKTVGRLFPVLLHNVFFLFGRPKPSLKIKPVGSFIHLFCYLFCVEQLLELGTDMNAMNDNNR